jgi:hypothetical protein
MEASWFLFLLFHKRSRMLGLPAPGGMKTKKRWVLRFTLLLLILSSISARAESWKPTRVGPPERRSGHTAIWNGSVMIVWGGWGGSGNWFRTGGRYDPSTDSWKATLIAGAPTGRAEHTAVWTGTEMIIWGGHDGIGLFMTGGRYAP